MLASNRDEFLSRSTTRTSYLSPSSLNAYITRPCKDSLKDLLAAPDVGNKMYAGYKMDTDKVQPASTNKHVVLLAPRDDHMENNGSWFLTASDGRFAILTNVRRPFSVFNLLDDPKIFATVFRCISLLCLTFFFLSIRRHAASIHAEVDRRENYVYEVVLNQVGDRKDAGVIGLALYYMPLVFDLTTGPLLIPTGLLWLFAKLLMQVRRNERAAKERTKKERLAQERPAQERPAQVRFPSAGPCSQTALAALTTALPLVHTPAPFVHTSVWRPLCSHMFVAPHMRVATHSFAL